MGLKSEEDIQNLEKLLNQLKVSHRELSVHARKKPHDALNKFKLDLINKILSAANIILNDKKPFEDFSQFDPDDLPTYSDVTLILDQYLEASYKYRSDNVVFDGTWVYVIDGHPSSVKTNRPEKR